MTDINHVCIAKTVKRDGGHNRHLHRSAGRSQKQSLTKSGKLSQQNAKAVIIDVCVAQSLD